MDELHAPKALHGVTEALTRKIGPLPGWAWALAGGGLLALYLHSRGGGGGSSTTTGPLVPASSGSILTGTDPFAGGGGGGGAPVWGSSGDAYVPPYESPAPALDASSTSSPDVFAPLVETLLAGIPRTSSPVEPAPAVPLAREAPIAATATTGFGGGGNSPATGYGDVQPGDPIGQYGDTAPPNIGDYPWLAAHPADPGHGLVALPVPDEPFQPVVVGGNVTFEPKLGAAAGAAAYGGAADYGAEYGSDYGDAGDTRTGPGYTTPLIASDAGEYHQSGGQVYYQSNHGTTGKKPLL